MTDLTAAPRPSLEQAPCKPDVLARLLHWYDRLAGLPGTLRGDIADAMDAISGLRDSDARRLTMIDSLKAELAEARAGQTEGR